MPCARSGWLVGGLGRLTLVALTLAPAAAVAALPHPAHRGRPAVEVADGPSPRADRELAALPPAAARRGWADFVGRQGHAHALWDLAAGAPATIVFAGRPAPDAHRAAARALAEARALLRDHIDLLAPGCSAADFELIADDLDAGVRTLGFRQRQGGLPVEGAHLSLRFAHDRLVLLTSQALPCPEAPPAPGDLVPAARARARALAWLAADGMQGLSVRGDVGAPVVLPRVGERGVLRRDLAVPVVVDVAAPRGRFLVHVDAHSGAPIARRQLLAFAAELHYDVPVQRPTGDRFTPPAALVGLTVDGAPQTTDLAGAFVLDAPGAVQTSVAGPFVNVVNDSGPEISAQLPASPGDVLVWSAAGDEFADAQLSTFIHAGAVKRYVKAIAPDLAWLDGQLQATVNIADVCNAFSDGDSINFFASGDGCENTGRLADVVFHEFGHSVHGQSLIPGVGVFNVSLSEGISDYLAATMTGDPAIGRGFFFDSTPIRELDPIGFEWHWPEDKGEVHDEGRIIGGTLWDLRKALIAKHGQALGVAHTDYLWYQSIRRAIDIPSMFLETLVADDDNGNLDDGTPNACEIAAAYEAHGLRPITVAAPSVTVLPPTASGTPVRLSFTAFLAQCGLPPVNATLHYRLRDNPGLGGSAPMLQSGGALEATIPVFPDDSLVQYRIDLSAGSIVQSLPQNAVDPWYELYVGPVDVLYCTSFDLLNPLDEGWSLGQGDAWQWGVPSGQSSVDPPAAYSGDHVVGVHVDGDGLYPPLTFASASTPVIPTAGYKRVRLQYRRWLTIEDGFFDQATILADGAPVWANFAGPDEIDSANQHIDLEWRFHDVDISSSAQDGQVQLTFEHQSDPGLEFGGWTLDDLCVVGVAAPFIVCGNGVVEAGEACDQGDLNSDSLPNACRTNCLWPACGDGVVDAGEACDDGNAQSGDGCSSTCAVEEQTTGETEGTSSGSGSGGVDSATATAGFDSDLVDRGCVCTTSGQSGAAPWFALALGALARRRRRAS